MGKLSSRVAKLERASPPKPLVIFINSPKDTCKPFTGFIAHWWGDGSESYTGINPEAVKAEIRQTAQRRNPQGITIVRIEVME